MSIASYPGNCGLARMPCWGVDGAMEQLGAFGRLTEHGHKIPYLEG